MQITNSGEPDNERQIDGQTSITKFFQTKNGKALVSKGNQKMYLLKPKKHPLSLMKDGVSTLRFLPDITYSIFKTIMPWRQEQEEEIKKRVRKLKHESEIKQQNLKKWFKHAEAPEQQQRVITKEEEKYQQQLHDGELDEDADDYSKLQKVVKVKEVQKVRLADYTSNVQAILINPKWRECDHFTKIIRLNQVVGGSQNETPAGTHKDDESDNEQEGNTPQTTIPSKAFNGISMEQFQQLIIPKSVMVDGILFIWVEKEYIMEVCKFLEGQEFYYVENMCWVMLNEEMKDGN